jgi:hypothetical protein
MKALVKNVFTLASLFLIFSYPAAGQSIRITGRLVEKEERKAVSNGIVFLNPGKISSITNNNGEFLINCTPGRKQLSTKVLGYKNTIINLNVRKDTIINLFLDVLPFELSEVTISGEKTGNVRINQHGNLVITPAAMRETPRLFSEPDLLKSLQLMPGVIAGKDGSSDIYVRGGGAGQNIILANGCYFYLPGHFLGLISPIDLDFLQSSELFKDYFPAELGGGASSVISLQFREPQSDSLKADLRLGMLSSGLSLEKRFKDLNLDVSAGLRRGNYSIYAPVLKLFGSGDIVEYLPSDDYAFYDGFVNINYHLGNLGNINYLFFTNYDSGDDEDKITGKNADTIVYTIDRITTGWKSMVHSVHWESAQKKPINWVFDINYNRLQMDREIDHEIERHHPSKEFDLLKYSYSFSPLISTLGSSLVLSGGNQKFTWRTGLNGKIKIFSPNITSNIEEGDRESGNKLGEVTRVNELAGIFSSTYHLTEKLQVDAGFRLSAAFLNDVNYTIPEPRIRLSYNNGGFVSPHVNYVRLSQFDHSVEGSNAGLRSMLWVPVTREFGPEISDVVSAGFQGSIKNNFVWSLDGYFKKIKGMVDYQSGASFVFDTTFTDLLESIDGRAYGLEAGIIKTSGSLTGSLSYTWSRSKREYYIPEGLIWIPSISDRPHNINLVFKYHFKTGTSFGLNWIYQSGAPATMYEQETSYGEFFDRKNNVRYFDYHRMDLSLRQVIYKRRFSVSIDADVYNVYNRKNTFYFQKQFDWIKKMYYFKNVSLFPIMPSLTVTIKY